VFGKWDACIAGACSSEAPKVAALKNRLQLLDAIENTLRGNNTLAYFTEQLKKFL
jgi:hypothetical protein